MGSIITLGINKLEIDWGKNYTFNNHSKLFKKNEFDSKIKYYEMDEYGEKEIVKSYPGAKAKLSNVKNRLDLLGYGINKLEGLYKKCIAEYEYYTDEKHSLSYNDYYEFIYSLDLKKVDIVKVFVSEYDDDMFDIGEYFRKCISKDVEISNKLNKVFKKISKDQMIVTSSFEAVDPYITLRILAENPANLEYDVEWRYHDVVEGGWVKKKELFKGLDEADKITLVTEGSSDLKILKRTIEELYPSISDFFYFMDPESYPFTGWTKMCDFCIGLSKINVINNIIAIFDNDTAGLIGFKKTKSKIKNNNILITHLPDMEEFKKFKTIGPNGESICDVNGKAVAIECFLDLSKNEDEPSIRWTNYEKDPDKYQGSLIDKEKYSKLFFSSNLKDGSYNVDKLKHLINAIIQEYVDNKK